MSAADAKKLAAMIRRAAGYPKRTKAYAVRCALAILGKDHVRVLRRFSTPGVFVASWPGTGRPAIMLRDDTRKNGSDVDFVAAHELGHWALWKTGRAAKAFGGPALDREERMADAIAEALLGRKDRNHPREATP